MFYRTALVSHQNFFEKAMYVCDDGLLSTGVVAIKNLDNTGLSTITSMKQNAKFNKENAESMN